MQARKSGKNLHFSVIFLLGLVVLPFKSFGTDSPSPIDLLKIDSVYQSAKQNFDTYCSTLYAEIGDPTINYTMFKQGMIGYHNLDKKQKLERKEILTLIDFSIPSNEPRLWIIDLCERKVLHTSLVSHGSKSGGLVPHHFSNEKNSHKSSLGFYVTGVTYNGKHDHSLRLHGMEHSNSNACSRGVVIHAAKYATYDFLEKNGCVLGRSYGCPAVPYENYEQLIEWIKEGTALYIYYPNRSYKRYSRYLNRRNYLEDFIV